EGLTGAGVTVAVIDSGLNGGSVAGPWVNEDLSGHNRVLVRFDAIKDATTTASDAYGHGTHVTSIVASSADPTQAGVAPNGSLVAVTAFDSTGAGTYANVIQALDYVVQNKTKYNIRVVNLSFSAPPRSHYWDDPLAQAVMRTWQAGIVVVVSAGNTGPNPMTVGVPANAPYVITVGAMTDHYTPNDPSDDYLASFSSTGPTAEGFVKPDVVAPGGHMLGVMDMNAGLAKRYYGFLASETAVDMGPQAM